MNIDDILNLWQEDVKIDRTELGDEALNIPKLHHKYYRSEEHTSELQSH